MSTRSSPSRTTAPGAALLLALLLPVFAWAPLTYPGYFEFHSGFMPVFNLNDFAANITDLSWSPVIGASYDVLRGEGRLPYLLAAIARVGMPSIAAVKCIFGLSLVSASLGMFAWARRRLGAWPALVAASVYVLCPIVLATVFVRGAFAEAALVGLIPWAFLAGDAAREGKRSGVVGLAVSVAAALWTQTGLALWVVTVLLLNLIIVGGKASRGARPWKAIAALGGGSLLGALALLPMIVQRGLGGQTAARFPDHFVYLNQLLGAWGNGASVAGPYDTLTFNLGLLAFALATVAFVLPGAALPDEVVRRIPAVLDGGHKWFALATGCTLVFLASVLASPLWGVVPFLARTLTFPWQLLVLAAPWLAWLAGLGSQNMLGLLPNDAIARHSLVAVLLGLVLLPAYADLKPLTTQLVVADAPLAIFGDNEIALLAVAPDGAVQPGADVTVEVRWQALRSLSRDYTVFFHVVGADGIRYGQQDAVPQEGASPTTSWRPGQIVTDRYRATISANAPPVQTYQYWLGLYSLETGQRLAIGADDKYVSPAPATR